MWISLILDSLPLKASFLPLEAEIYAEAMVLRCEWPQGNLKQKVCQGYSQSYHHVNMGHNQHQHNML